MDNLTQVTTEVTAWQAVLVLYDTGAELVMTCGTIAEVELGSWGCDGHFCLTSCPSCSWFRFFARLRKQHIELTSPVRRQGVSSTEDCY
jgi:hypothetical protein